MHDTITLTRRGVTVEVTLHNSQYAEDCFGFSYSLSYPGFWREHGSGDVWQEVSRTDAAALQAAA